MADHYRQQVRDAVVAAVTGLATTGPRVLRNRVHPVEEETLPCLLVYSLREESEIEAIGRPRGLLRALDLAVVAVSRDRLLDDALDAVCAEVEAALGAATLGGLVKDLTLEETEVQFDGEAERPTGRARMTWRALYRTPENDPTTGA